MERQLPAGSMIFELLSGCSNNYIFMGNLETGELTWSDNAVETFLVKSREIKDKEIWKAVIWEKDVEAFEGAVQKLLTGEQRRIQGEYHVKLKDGRRIPAQFNIWPVELDAAGGCYAGVITNLVCQSSLDTVTGLGSIYDFRAALTELLKKKVSCGLLAIEIDSLRRINDAHSYMFGDEVLKKFVTELENRIGQEGTLYRLDGEGLVLLYPGADKTTLAIQFAKFQEILLMPFVVQDIPVAFEFCGAGCVSFEDGNTTEELLKSMRIALNIAQSKGGSQFVAYTEQIAERANRELVLMERLRESVNHHFEGFSLNYQPLIYAESGELYGCEVLLRWFHPDLPEGTSPTEFIPMLENMGLIFRIGKWVIREALHQLSKWALLKPDFQMSINAACSQFEDPEFRFYVMDCLCREKLNPNLLTLELTESNQIKDTEAISHAFDFFRGQGIKIAFDDFGMGYASFDIFRLLSADELKIDKSFLERLTYDVTDQKIIAHLIRLCDSMNMHVCVEGVETTEVLNIIRQLGPKFLQGYYYNKPMTAERFEEFYLQKDSPKKRDEPKHETAEKKQSMVYAEYRPVQPMTMEDLVNSAYAGIFQVGMDEEFTFLTCNEGYRRMLGYTAKEMEDKFKNQALGFVHPDDMTYVNEEIRRQLGMGDTVIIEFRIIRADGSPLWILGTGNVSKGKNGTSSLSVVIVNNNEFKKKQLEIAEQHKKYKRILEHIPTSMKCVRYDEAFTLEYISPSFLNLMGYNESEIQTLFHNKYINLIYEEDRDQLINDIFEQLKESNIVTLRYRSRCKDGRLIWVETVSRLCPPDSDGVQRCYSNVVNITDTITEVEKKRSRSLANRYQEAAARWGDVLFEANSVDQTLHFSDEYRSMFGREPEATVEEELKNIHPEDWVLVTETLQKAIEGQECVPIEIRALKDGAYRWYAIYVNEPDKLGETSMAVLGKICDIDSEKRERNKLLVKSQQDPLTSLLNKSTLEERIRLRLSSLQGKEEYVLYMIDVDDFKNVNDRMGHPFGDFVLREMGERLTRLLGEGAYIGRAGGDEFMAFVKMEEGIDASYLGGCIVSELHGMYRYGDHEMEISLSVGGACCPDDGSQFYELFRRADSALYRSKAKGKNQSCLFYETLINVSKV